MKNDLNYFISNENFLVTTIYCAASIIDDVFYGHEHSLRRILRKPFCFGFKSPLIKEESAMIIFACFLWHLI